MWSTCAGRWRRLQRSGRPPPPTPGWAASSSRRTPRPDAGTVLRRGDGTAGRPPRRGHGARRGRGAARGATLYVTLEPCAHHGRTPPCTDAIVAAGVARVVVGIEDPDQQVAGPRASPPCGPPASRSAWAWRRRGRRAAGPLPQAPDDRDSPGSCSRWRPASTAAPPRPTAPAAGSPGEAARQRRAPAAGPLRRRARRGGHGPGRRSRADGPPRRRGRAPPQPLRVVLGPAPAGAKVHPALELSGDLERRARPSSGAAACSSCWSRAGATVAHDFHAAGLVDRYVLYLAPVLLRGRRRPPDLRRARGWHNWGRVEGQAGVGRATG